jgi:hypothetical protein
MLLKNILYGPLEKCIVHNLRRMQKKMQITTINSNGYSKIVQPKGEGAYRFLE